MFIKDVSGEYDEVGSKSTKAMCSGCRDAFKRQNEEEWEANEFRRFID